MLSSCTKADSVKILANPEIHLRGKCDWNYQHDLWGLWKKCKSSRARMWLAVKHHLNIRWVCHSQKENNLEMKTYCTDSQYMSSKPATPCIRIILGLWFNFIIFIIAMKLCVLLLVGSALFVWKTLRSLSLRSIFFFFFEKLLESSSPDNLNMHVFRLGRNLSTWRKFTCTCMENVNSTQKWRVNLQTHSPQTHNSQTYTPTSGCVEPQSQCGSRHLHFCWKLVS